MCFALCALMFGLVACAADPGGGGGDDDDCGDGTCQSGESELSCPADCDKTPKDECGDKVCGATEATSCPADCGVCGNKTCEASEATSCPKDCEDEVCGNDMCKGDETATTCPHDCGASVKLQNNSDRYIYNFYIWACGTTGPGPDLTGTAYIPPDYSFTVSEIPPGCWHLRATTYDQQSYWQTLNVDLVSAVVHPWTLGN
ncbi:MAG: hypothetical protein WKG01_01635 [Kofleriaceae bacterium]